MAEEKPDSEIVILANVPNVLETHIATFEQMKVAKAMNVEIDTHLLLFIINVNKKIGSLDMISK